MLSLESQLHSQFIQPVYVNCGIQKQAVETTNKTASVVLQAPPPIVTVSMPVKLYLLVIFLLLFFFLKGL